MFAGSLVPRRDAYNLLAVGRNTPASNGGAGDDDTAATATISNLQDGAVSVQWAAIRLAGGAHILPKVHAVVDARAVLAVQVDLLEHGERLHAGEGALDGAAGAGARGVQQLPLPVDLAAGGGILRRVGKQTRFRQSDRKPQVTPGTNPLFVAPRRTCSPPSSSS